MSYSSPLRTAYDTRVYGRVNRSKIRALRVLNFCRRPTHPTSDNSDYVKVRAVVRVAHANLDSLAGYGTDVIAGAPGTA